MEYLTFMNKKQYKDVKENRLSLMSDVLCKTTSEYSMGIIQPVDSAVDQLVLLCSLVTPVDATYVCTVDPEHKLDTYGIVEVNSHSSTYAMKNPEHGIAVIDYVDAQRIVSTWYSKLFLTYHELVFYRYNMLLEWFGFDTELDIDWQTIKKQWRLIEKDNTLTQANFDAIRGAIKERKD